MVQQFSWKFCMYFILICSWNLNFYIPLNLFSGKILTTFNTAWPKLTWSRSWTVFLGCHRYDLCLHGRNIFSIKNSRNSGEKGLNYCRNSNFQTITQKIPDDFKIFCLFCFLPFSHLILQNSPTQAFVLPTLRSTRCQDQVLLTK